MSSEPSRTAGTEAAETIGGVLTDLREVAGHLPVPPAQAEHVARILDRLSEEIAEAAGMLRAALLPQPGQGGSL